MSTESFSRGVRPEWVDGKLFPFKSRFVELSGNVVHYVDEGEGPILLMLHGNPTWSFVYRDVIAELSGSFRCIAPDYPGFGYSSAPAPAEFAYTFDHLDMNSIPPTMRGWSASSWTVSIYVMSP